MLSNGQQILSSWSHGVKLLMEEDNPLTGDDPPHQQTTLFEMHELECRECHHPLGPPWHHWKTRRCRFTDEPPWWRRLCYWLRHEAPFIH